MDATRVRTAAGVLAGASLLLAAAGCNFVAGIGGMADSYQRTGTSTVEAQYSGLAGGSFAVIVAADRMIQADFPALVPQVTAQISQMLHERANASGWVPPERVLEFQYRHPRWVTQSEVELADRLGVDRLVFVELAEFRLHDRGNPYLWNGSATASVRVIDMTSPAPSLPVHEEGVAVVFPDNDGYGPAELPEEAVYAELARRMVRRVAWQFYTHEERNDLPY